MEGKRTIEAKSFHYYAINKRYIEENSLFKRLSAAFKTAFSGFIMMGTIAGGLTLIIACLSPALP